MTQKKSSAAPSDNIRPEDFNHICVSGSVDEIVNLFRIMMTLGQTSEVERICAQIISDYPQRKELMLYSISKAYAQQNNYERCLQFQLKLVETQATNENLFDLAHSYYKLSEFDKAEEALKRIQGKSKEKLFRLVTILREKESYQEAILLLSDSLTETANEKDKYEILIRLSQIMLNNLHQYSNVYYQLNDHNVQTLQSSSYEILMLQILCSHA